MGNSQSSKSGTELQDTGLLESEARVVLSDDLKKDIVLSFNSQSIQTEWEKFALKFLTERNARISEDDQRKVQLEHNLSQWREQNDAVQKSLDEKIDQAKKQFNEAHVAIQVDLTDMETHKVPKFGGGDDACFDVRSSLTKCYKEGGDVRKCDDLVNAMEMCVKKTVMS